MTNDTKDDGIGALGKMIAGAAADALMDHVEAALRLAVMLGIGRYITIKTINAAMLTWPGWAENKGKFDPAEADRLMGKTKASTDSTIEDVRMQLSRGQ